MNIIFELKMKVFITAYDGLAKKSDDNIFYDISLKRLINSYSEFSEEYNKEEKEIFQNILNKKKSEYNPDGNLKKMEDSLICLSFSDKSILSETYGTNEICGKFLGLRDGQNVSLKQNDGLLEEKFARIAFEFAYPNINEKFIVTSFDLKKSDIF
jgi:hypothetical protein